MTEQATAAIVINGYQVSAQWDDGEARIRDTELAAKLEYSRARDIRALIGGLIRNGKLSNVHHCGAAPRRSDGLPSRRGTEYWLTERQVLQVIRYCETPVADAIYDEVIDVFMAWRAGKLATCTDARLATALEAIADLQRMNTELQRELLAQRTEIAALRAGTISTATHTQVRADVRRLAALEHAAGHWPSARAATRDIYREMGREAEWGGKGQPWKYLPVERTHTALTVLRGREASIKRELRLLAADRQLELPMALRLYTAPKGQPS